MRRTSSMVSSVSAVTHAGGRLVEAKQLRLGGERDADFEIALLAVRQIGGQLVGLAEQADGISAASAFSLMSAKALWCEIMFQPWRRDCAAMRTFSSAVALGRILVIW